MKTHALCAGVLICCLFAGDSSGETVILQNGETRTGSVIDADEKYILLETGPGKTEWIARKNIKGITRRNEGSTHLSDEDPGREAPVPEEIPIPNKTREEAGKQ